MSVNGSPDPSLSWLASGSAACRLRQTPLCSSSAHTATATASASATLITHTITYAQPQPNWWAAVRYKAEVSTVSTCHEGSDGMGVTDFRRHAHR